jgi:hypothetical protein
MLCSPRTGSRVEDVNTPTARGVQPLPSPLIALHATEKIAGGHIGFGGGLWGAVLDRLLLGAEVDADVILSVAYDGSVAQRVGVTLAIGAWI